MKRLVTCSSSRTRPCARSDSSVTFTVSRAGVRLGLSRNRDSAGLSAAIERPARPAPTGGRARKLHRQGSSGYSGGRRSFIAPPPPADVRLLHIDDADLVGEAVGHDRVAVAGDSHIAHDVA